MIGWVRKHAVSAAMRLADREIRGVAETAVAEAISTMEQKLRSFESADSNRLNSSQWGRVGDEAVNDYLASQLPVLRMRSWFESLNSGIFAGIIETHTTDVIGEHGPSLQVRVGAKGGEQDDDWASRAEDLWDEFWSMPDLNEELAGVDFLDLAFRGQWTDGASLLQFVNGQRRNGITLRLLGVEARRLVDPIGATASSLSQADRLVSGVDRDANGRPLQYWIRRSSSSTEVVPVRARNMIHLFRRLEHGQAIGAPWASVTLQAMRDLRDFDIEVLDAARAAADSGILLNPKGFGDEIDPIEMPGSVQVERRRITTVPLGYEAMQMRSEQPAANYVEYRHERFREAARAVCMPLMMILLDSSGHNYSSARFDAQSYQRAVRKLQGWISRAMLRPIFDRLVQEAVLSGRLRLPGGPVRLVWTWPVAPHVDPVKESQAETIRMQNGTLTFRDACAAHGFDWEDVLAQHELEAPRLEAVGLPRWPQGGGQIAATTPDDDRDDEQDSKPEDGNRVETHAHINGRLNGSLA